ncbi:type III toxin-antitoxin system TenpIN family toxin [Paenibacillus radicis (ex Xue et al. 2023)]|uniref:Type III toxin-antitoxin system ToxN/AbiQ family toxin n=1 Tax=Paenibacillus radicis (ex Xue et al. 2023) TaxID=2972489 RepID=A0ABT1YVL4_9BACL|nr:hypothetical protein [Paenibacillus radicis (ex Xue et al. 2023)]MCR8636952.1 hypothetical protein [Paenibacillus radicis (ex Xue et al. 2023)]
MADNKIVFHRLTSDFYKEHTHLVETIKDEGRGYGVLLVTVLGYKFAIPLRSKMDLNHPANFTTKIHSPDGKNVRHGLDYTKALIITEDRFVLSEKDYKLRDKSDYLKIVELEHKIIIDFEKFVQKYIKAVKKQDKHILRQYRFSTMKNYHVELGCNLPINPSNDIQEMKVF